MKDREILNQKQRARNGMRSVGGQQQPAGPELFMKKTGILPKDHRKFIQLQTQATTKMTPNGPVTETYWYMLDVDGVMWARIPMNDGSKDKFGNDRYVWAAIDDERVKVELLTKEQADAEIKGHTTHQEKSPSIGRDEYGAIGEGSDEKGGDSKDSDLVS